MILLAGAAACGCFPQESRHVGAVDPVNNIPAIRFYAIESLYRITGKTFDYHYYDDENERRPAVKRWQKWMAEQK